MKPKKPIIGDIIYYWSINSNSILKMPGLVLKVDSDNTCELLVFRPDNGQSQFFGNVKHNNAISEGPINATWSFINRVEKSK